MDPISLAASIVILLFSVIVHEVMHGYAALRFGDHTAKNAGRLTLNPIPHIDPIGTIFLPLILIVTNSPILFGWAKPVPVNSYHFSNMRLGERVVAASGVISNFGLAIISAVLFHILLQFQSTDLFIPMNILSFAVHINLVLAVFNLLPIPPLDGSKILMTYLPPDLEAQYRRFEGQGMFILLFLMIIPFGHGSLLGTILGIFVNFFHKILGV